MAKKFMSGIMAAVILLFSFLGSGGQVFAATGGASLSKWVYAEPGELTHNGLIAYGNATFPTGVTEQSIWHGVDSLLDIIAGNGGNLYTGSSSVIWHVFERHIFYDTSNGAVVTGGYDNHYIVAVPKSANASPERAEGRLFFKNAAGTRVPYEYLGFKNSLESGEFEFKSLTPPQGVVMGTVTPEHGISAVFEIMTTGYDPESPPGYALPGNTEYNSSFPNDPDPNDPDDPDSGMPQRPQPPEDNWDVIGWFKYLLDWIIYVFDSFVWLLAQLGSSVGRMLEGADNLVSFVGGFFSFLPDEIVTLMGIGIIVAIILRIFKR